MFIKWFTDCKGWNYGELVFMSEHRRSVNWALRVQIWQVKQSRPSYLFHTVRILMKLFFQQLWFVLSKVVAEVIVFCLVLKKAYTYSNLFFLL